MKKLSCLVSILLLMWGCGDQSPTGTGSSQSNNKVKQGKVTDSVLTHQAQSVPVVSQKSSEGEEFTYDPEGRRDPFRSLLFVGSKPKGGTPLQQRGLAEIKLVGIVWEKSGYAAMVETPDGKGYTLRPGILVGPGGGKVKTITEKSVIIEETYTDFTGAKKSKETVIGLRTKEEELE